MNRYVIIEEYDYRLKIYRVTGRLTTENEMLEVYKGIFLRDWEGDPSILKRNYLFLNCISINNDDLEQKEEIIVTANNINGNKFLEFPDDKSAILWFKLEYGG